MSLYYAFARSVEEKVKVAGLPVGRGSVVLLAFLHVVALAYLRVLQYIQYSIFFDSCLGEERSLFEFEVVTLREPPGRDPSLLFYFHPYIWYVESLVKSTLLDRVCFNFTLDSCRVARLTSGRVNL